MTGGAGALERLGWRPELAAAFAPFSAQGLLPARVVAEHRAAYDVVCAAGAFTAEVSGVFRRAAASKADFPAVGDWAAIAFSPSAARQTIHALLPRRSKLSRLSPVGEEQVVAANVDAVFIVQGLDGNYNLNRLERYLAAIRSSGAEAVVVLNKADLDPEAGLKAGAVRAALGAGIPVLLLDSINKTGYDALAALLPPGRVVVLAGSSGTGKSTIINNLMGAALQRTEAVREEDSKGRHTTTGRKLFVLPGGALLIDTPGMRGLGLLAEDGQAVEETFDDVQTLAAQCRFGNCSHSNEPGCSVREALEAGTLARKHYENYVKLRKETAFLKSKSDLEERLKRKNAAKNLSKDIKDVSRRKRPRP